MNYEIEDLAFPVIKCTLEMGESIKVTGSSVIGHSSRVKITNGVEGGLLKGIGRMISGDKVFYQYATAERTNGEILLSSRMPGSCIAVQLPKSGMRVIKDSLIGCERSVEIGSDIKLLTKAKLADNSVQVLKLNGEGTVFLGGLGSIFSKRIGKDSEYIVSANSFIGCSNTADVSVEKSRNGLVNFFNGGVQTVFRIKGPGVVLLRSCNAEQFKTWITENGFWTKEDMKSYVDSSISKLEKITQEKKEQLSKSSLSEERFDLAKEYYDNLDNARKELLEQQVVAMMNMTAESRALLQKQLVEQGFPIDVILMLEDQYREAQDNGKSLAGSRRI